MIAAFVLQKLDRFSTAVVALLARPMPFLSAMAAYYLLVAAVVAISFTGTSIDTSEQMLFAQTWSLTYDDANPPLFTWLVKLAELALGTGEAAVLLAKFGCLWVMHAFLHALGRSLQLPATITVLAGLSPLLLYYLAWDATYTYSHSLLMTASLAAAAWATACVVTHPSPERYLALGLVLGIGLVSKYNFGIFALGLVVVLALHPATRGRRSRLALALVFVAPALGLMLAQSGRLATAATDRLSITSDVDIAAATLHVLAATLGSVWQFLLPALPLCLLLFWRMLVSRPERSIPPAVGVLAWTLAVSLTAMVAGLILARATSVRTPYVFVFMLAPVLLILLVSGYPRLERSARLLVLAPLAIMLAIPPAVALKGAVEADGCRRCFLAFDYTALASEMRRLGFSDGTIVGQLDDQGRTGGLRPHFPASRLVSLRYPDFIPPPRSAEGGQCALVWNAAAVGDPEAALRGFAEEVLDTVPPDAAPTSINLPLASEGDRGIAINALIWAPTDGRCR